MVNSITEAQSISHKKKTRKATKAESKAINLKTDTSETGKTTFKMYETPDLPEKLVAYAKTLQGTPYVYASTDPGVGFDCSGFITYVFNHFHLNVPRTSVGFTNFGLEIRKEETNQGDLILFTGTDSTIRIVGHMGIITENISGTLHFIHSSSGHANGVVITQLNNYYQSRFVKTIRVFEK